jgi:hypothetical protein
LVKWDSLIEELHDAEFAAEDDDGQGEAETETIQNTRGQPFEPRGTSVGEQSQRSSSESGSEKSKSNSGSESNEEGDDEDEDEADTLKQKRQLAAGKVTTPKCDTCFILGTWEGVVQKNYWQSR